MSEYGTATLAHFIEAEAVFNGELPRAYIYRELPDGFYGWVNEETGELCTNPIISAELYRWGEKQFPGYAAASKLMYDEDIAELERMMK